VRREAKSSFVSENYKTMTFPRSTLPKTKSLATQLALILPATSPAMFIVDSVIAQGIIFDRLYDRGKTGAARIATRSTLDEG
jgi:hypothetical protein